MCISFGEIEQNPVFVDELLSVKKPSLPWHHGVMVSQKSANLSIQLECTGSIPVDAVFVPLAQMVEHLTFNQVVVRSNRIWHIIKDTYSKNNKSCKLAEWYSVIIWEIKFIGSSPIFAYKFVSCLFMIYYEEIIYYITST